MAAAPVTWVTVQKHAHDVVISTYGRGLYILPDITRLEQNGPPAGTAAFLYAPRPAFRALSCVVDAGTASPLFRNPGRSEILTCSLESSRPYARHFPEQPHESPHRDYHG